MTTQWHCMMKQRSFFPDHIDIDDQDEAAQFVLDAAIADARNWPSYRIDTMTDQINVYQAKRLVATYMAS